ncbi:MAG: hypothetical protein ACREXI_10525 [Caldimonas sp.]
MKLTVARVEVLVWVLIYGGLLTFAVGLALRGYDRLLARRVSVAGIGVAAAGAFLIWVRSRMVAHLRAAALAAGAHGTDPPTEGKR